MILGQSGTGKSASLRNMKPQDVLLIQPVRKPLPFKSAEWKPLSAESKEGNVYVSDSSAHIIHAMRKTQRPVIVIDDYQYILANEFMRRSDERGYDKFTEIAKHAWDIFMEANDLPGDKRVYILAHTDTADDGRVKAKTIGKLLDEKITLEGLVSIVLRTQVVNGQYLLRTQNNGNDTVKSPIGLFDNELIDNDLAIIDQQITDYYKG
jgi:hypothetical protein